MQDRFKYRCWHKPTKTMYEVFEFNKTFIKATPSFVVTSIRTIKTEDCILIQCTGLKDKNGKLIFEGDILKGRKSDNGSSLSSRMIDEIGVVEIPDGMFIASCRDTVNNCTLFCQCEWNNTEVIGNIYENLELIGGKEWLNT